MLYTIGEFSRITQLSPKALRLYHKSGLLVPFEIDSESGYRRYHSDQIADARRIVTLKSLGFSLDDISQIIKTCGDDSDLITHLKSKQSALKIEIRNQKKSLAQIEHILNQELHAMEITHTDIEEKILPDQLIAGHRMVGKYEEIGKGFKVVAPAAGRKIEGKPFALHYCQEYREDDADFEACFPVKSEVVKDSINCRILSGGKALTLVHKGSYETIGHAYEALISEIKKRNLVQKTPSREVYIKGPGIIFRGNPKHYITEVQILVE